RRHPRQRTRWSRPARRRNRDRRAGRSRAGNLRRHGSAGGRLRGSALQSRDRAPRAARAFRRPRHRRPGAQGQRRGRYRRAHGHAGERMERYRWVGERDGRRHRRGQERNRARRLGQQHLVQPPPTPRAPAREVDAGTSGRGGRRERCWRRSPPAQM
ncbi:hypothetical protein LTR16_007387, partial [Cryomyces antarcticus]